MQTTTREKTAPNKILPRKPCRMNCNNDIGGIEKLKLDYQNNNDKMVSNTICYSKRILKVENKRKYCQVVTED